MNEQPPKFAHDLLNRLIRPEFLEPILGDLEERFEEDITQYGLGKAKRKYIRNAVGFIRPGLMKKIGGTQKLNAFGMLKHHIKLSFRSFRRFKTSFLINLIGLSSGLACTLLIYLWVSDEWNMDKFHAYDDHLYQVKQNINIINKIETIDPTPAYLGQALLEEFPAVERMTSVVPVGSYGSDGVIERGEKQFKALEQYATSDYFEVFSFPLKIGAKSNVLSSKENVVISQSLSDNLFGEGVDPRGESINWLSEGETFTYVVSGVFEPLPDNTSEYFDVVFHLETFLDRYPHIRDWGNSDPSTYIVLSEDASPEDFHAQIKDFLLTKKEEYPHTLLLQKYSDTYLFGKYQNGIPLPGRMQYVRLFVFIAGLVLVIACINFMNLSTARASRRLKEIGVKKAMGVSRNALVVQFFTETFLLTFISIVLAFLLVSSVLTPFNHLVGKQLVLDLNYELLSFSFAILIGTTILSGSYPALYLSGFKPMEILKGKLSGTAGDLWARKGLVIVQYCASAVLITSVMVVSSQIKYVLNKNLGFDKEHVIYFNADGGLDEQSPIFINELKNIPGVVNAAGFSHDLLGGMGKTTGLNWEGKDPDERIRFGNLEVGYNLIETFGMELAAGRTFSKEMGDNNSKIVLNEKAIEATGIKDPIGKTIQLWGGNREIIGVVKNFHFESLHAEIMPCFFQITESHSSIVVRLSPGDQLKTVEQIEALYHEYNPALSFNFQFFDQAYDAQYKSEQQIASLSSYFAGIAIIISCLGLFGLVAFTAERRQKEIGIRKVLGAGVMNLVLLLSSDFMKIVFIAIVISGPLSYWLLQSWLESFVYRIQMDIWFFVAAGLLALFIALVTMSAQTLRAATANPVDSLKDE